MTYSEVRKNISRNLFANLLDGSFFGLALGFASFITILPLFVSTMTKSAILIGLIPAIHNVGWQFPQLLTAYRVSRQSAYKPMVIRLTLNERIPFLGLAAVAYLLPVLGTKLALIITFILLAWQGLGGGFAAAAWQSMIAKIFPPEIHGTFYGMQSSVANLLASLSAVLAGFILEKTSSPQGFTICFLLASISMAISWNFLNMTREAVVPPASSDEGQTAFRAKIGSVLRQDSNFRWFLVYRMLAQFGIMAFAFFTVYAVTQHHTSEASVGLMTAVFLAAQILANPIMGWLGDHWSNRSVMVIGMLSASVSAIIAWRAPDPGWFYLVFILAGIGNVAVWTVSLAMILRFGKESERPVYIGLANTLVAPATILAPLLAGWLVDVSGYSTAFLASGVGGLIATGILYLMVKDPETHHNRRPGGAVRVSGSDDEMID